ncbi:MAG TPA: 4'-phosphopantetheinyl transferase superfamily protein [Steroidobacteraceae bacterium]|jgi:4'-phosphopantetheinyl transferase
MSSAAESDASMTRLQCADAPGTLARNAVHVWHIPVQPPAAMARMASTVLTSAEQARAARFVRAEDRIRFQLGRLAARLLLSRYQGQPLGEVTIEPDQHGKPQAGGASKADPIQFNLSHSGEWILAAFAIGLALGIDVEQMDSERVRAELVEYFMSDAERRAWQQLDEAQRCAAFFKCWTSKEAFLKGHGIGLRTALRSIEVSVDPAEPARLLSAPGELSPQGWRLYTLGTAAGYAGTLAVAASSAQVVEIVDVSWQALGAS